MADRAVEPGELDPVLLAPADADRKIALAAVGRALVEEAERRVVETPRELLGEQPRQGLPDPVGQPIRLGPDRAILEVLDRVGEVGGAILRQAPGDVVPAMAASRPSSATSASNR